MEHRRWSTLAPDHHQLRHRTFAQRAAAGIASDDRPPVLVSPTRSFLLCLIGGAAGSALGTRLR